MQNRRYQISVLVCTYHSEEAIDKSIKQVLKQYTYPGFNYEIVIVGDGVDLMDYINRLRKLKKQVKYIYVDNPDNLYHPSYVRNRGLEKCEGQLVFLLHDNVSLLRGIDYFIRLWELSEGGKKAVYTDTLVKIYKEDGSIDDYQCVPGFYAHQDAVPLHYFKQVGGFDETFDGDKAYDDKDLELRLKQIGCDFVNGGELFSIKHNMRNLRAQNFPNKCPGQDPGIRNAGILSERTNSGYYNTKIP